MKRTNRNTTLSVIYILSVVINIDELWQECMAIFVLKLKNWAIKSILYGVHHLP